MDNGTCPIFHWNCGEMENDLLHCVENGYKFGGFKFEVSKNNGTIIGRNK